MPRKEPTPEAFSFGWRAHQKAALKPELSFDFLADASKLFREAKLFCSGGRITLTFFAANEVGSIHFNRPKGEIFYKGRNIRDVELKPEELLFLRQFINYLHLHEVDPAIESDYQHCLQQILHA